MLGENRWGTGKWGAVVRDVRKIVWGKKVKGLERMGGLG